MLEMSLPCFCWLTDCGVEPELLLLLIGGTVAGARHWCGACAMSLAVNVALVEGSSVLCWLWVTHTSVYLRAAISAFYSMDGSLRR